MIFKDFLDSDDLLTPVTPNDPGMISKVFLTCLDWLKDHSYQISAQLEHFVSNRKWRHYEPLVTLNDLKSNLNMFRMP